MHLAMDGTAPCACQSGQLYARCCQPYHTGTPAPSAELLMRSRYCGYVLGLVAYLQATWHATTLPADLSCDDTINWLGLTIKNHYPSASNPTKEAYVEFVARYKIGGQRAQRLHEISRFIQQPDSTGTLRWYYVDGEFVEG